ncbi:MAG: tRNA 2-thiouridine(34) synthase MnmA [Caldisericales bacterium]|nr:tRNA 2-thiouridine(34) synthase MnmA [Caldisericales bacterium]
MARILVGMSGGTDSTAAVLVLRSYGHEVSGASLPICGRESIDTAIKASEQIGIKHYLIPIQNLFKTQVIEYFKSSIIRNETPNPCVMCNQMVKMHVLHKFAMQMGFEYIATGHYAKKISYAGHVTVAKADYEIKDQSYMLARVDETVLQKCLFPLGTLTRAEAESKISGLPATPPSQDACFINMPMRDWIAREIGIGQPGEIVDTMGNVIGEHSGLNAFTHGQREGIGLAGGPWYVVKKDVKTNTLVVGHKENVQISRFRVTDLRLISDDKPQVMIRYRSNPVECKIEHENNGDIFVSAKTPVFAPTPGQFAVFYSRNILIGSAIITE